MIISVFLITMNLCLSKVTMNSSSHKYPIEMGLEWRLGDISVCFSWLDKFCIEIWDWCVDAIVYELGSFTLIGFYDGSLVWNIVFVESRYYPVHHESDIGSF